MAELKQKKVKGIAHCGVSQCNEYKTELVSMHKISKRILGRPSEILKWKIALKMGKEFPKNFFICSRHFESRYLLRAIHSGNSNEYLSKNAFPTENLPQSSIKPKRIHDSFRAHRLMMRSATKVSTSSFNTQEDMTASDYLEHVGNKGTTSEGVQCKPEVLNKCIQSDIKFVNIASLWNTETKINTMTGLPSIAILNVLVEVCENVRKDERCSMSMRNRILLTMHKLKSNCSFAELAIGFELSNKTAKLYFADTISLLAKLTKKLIYWQSEERNLKNLPACFRDFSNVRTILDCTEIKTIAFRCLTCRICTYSNYKGMHTLKVLIGVSPSGSINFLSKVSTGRSSDKAIFNKDSELLKLLKPGDAVMVDKGFMIADELSNSGIEMIRPTFLFETFSKEDVGRNTKIAVARVHVERRIARLKMFRILSEKIGVSVIPYVDDIITVICGLSNISPPILSDDKFV